MAPSRKKRSIRSSRFKKDRKKAAKRQRNRKIVKAAKNDRPSSVPKKQTVPTPGSSCCVPAKPNNNISTKPLNSVMMKKPLNRPTVKQTKEPSCAPSKSLPKDGKGTSKVPPKSVGETSKVVAGTPKPLSTDGKDTAPRKAVAGSSKEITGTSKPLPNGGKVPAQVNVSSKMPSSEAEGSKVPSGVPSKARPHHEIAAAIKKAIEIKTSEHGVATGNQTGKTTDDGEKKNAKKRPRILVISIKNAKKQAKK